MSNNTPLPPPVKGRCRGALLGLAAGDALGAAVEFRTRDTFPPVTGYRGGGPHPIGPGCFTDDTSMALALAASLGESKGWDPRDCMDRFLAWKEKGAYSVTGRCFDIGNATAAALSRYKKTGNPYSGSTDPKVAGNGSLMRLAPVSIYAMVQWDTDPVGCAQWLAAVSSRTTHAAPQCLDACEVLATVLCRLVLGESKEAALEPTRLAFAKEPRVQAVVRGTYRTLPRDRVDSSGWVVATLEAALWAFWTTDTFEQCVLKAVNLAQDSDTVGAVAGQLAGAFYGEAGIPGPLLSGLARMDMIQEALVHLGVG